MVRRSGFFVFVICWRLVAPYECIIKDNQLKSIHLKPQHWHHYELPRRSDSFLRDNLRLQGRSYAGKAEFPWLVDLRTVNQTQNWNWQDKWANGIMITAKFLVTTCDAVAKFKQASKGGNSFDREKGQPNWYLTRKNPKDHVVMYSASYHYITREKRKDEVGTRLVKAFIPHPKCNYFVLDYSVGVAEIEGEPIFPFPPYTSYSHMDWNCAAFQYLKITYNQPIENRKRDEEALTCRIGLWGRDIPGDAVQRFDVSVMRQYFVLMDHKVRYVVRFVDPVFCQRNLNAYPLRFQYYPIDYMECMAIHEDEMVGVVCNHDRGAPIVCGGVVRAILVAGATEPYCNNSLPLPFLVIDARFMYTMYSNIHSLVLHNLTNLYDKQGGQSGSRQTYYLEDPCVLLFVLFVILVT